VCDSSALDSIYADYGTVLFSQARRILQNREDARDCVHDVLLKLWLRPNLYRPEKGSLRNFLLACVGNEARSRQRMTGRRERILRNSAPRTATASFDTDAYVERLQLCKAIASLPPLQREAIAMHYLQDMRHTDIAQTLRTPVGTIKTRIHQAKRRLRFFLSDEPSKFLQTSTPQSIAASNQFGGWKSTCKNI
jgi:RNA polymerase sigma-70 factor, ECF subfamily